MMTFIVSFYSSYFFCCLGFCGPKAFDFFFCIFQTETHGYYLIVFVISVGSYNILFD